MAQRLYKVRLQEVLDLDLINFVKNYDVSARLFFKDCLRNYVQNKQFLYDMPECINNQKLNKVEIQLRFDENDEIEAKIIKLLNGIKKGYTNDFIKNIVRSYIKLPIIIPNSNFSHEVVKEGRENGLYPPSRTKRGSKVQEDISKQDNFKKNTGIYALNSPKIKTNEENSSKVIVENNIDLTSTEGANSIRKEEGANSIRIVEETNSIRIEEPVEKDEFQENFDPVAMMTELCAC